jgi:hypothetical protein
VVIVNQKLAERYWPGRDPIGMRLKWGIGACRAPWLTFVGVIGDVADGPVGNEAGIHAYEPFRQFPDFFLDGAVNQFGRDIKAAVLAEGEPLALAGLLRKAIARLDPQLAVESIELMDQQVRASLAPHRLSTLLVSVFAALALLLASVGLYGLLSFITAQRRGSSRRCCTRRAATTCLPSSSSQSCWHARPSRRACCRRGAPRESSRWRRFGQSRTSPLPFDL